MMKAYNPKKSPPPSDWDNADIQCALKKRGWTLRKLSQAHGYEASAAAHAFRRPWPRIERIIAHVIGVKPWEIWPSRYDEDHRSVIGVRRRLRELQYTNPDTNPDTDPAVPFNVKNARVRIDMQKRESMGKIDPAGSNGPELYRPGSSRSTKQREDSTEHPAVLSGIPAEFSGFYSGRGECNKNRSS